MRWNTCIINIPTIFKVSGKSKDSQEFISLSLITTGYYFVKICLQLENCLSNSLSSKRGCLWTRTLPILAYTILSICAGADPARGREGANRQLNSWENVKRRINTHPTPLPGGVRLLFYFYLKKVKCTCILGQERGSGPPGPLDSTLSMWINMH